MAFPLALNNLVEATLICRLDDQNGLMVMHYFVSNLTAVGVTDADLALELDNKFATQMKNLLSGDAFYTGVKVQLIEPLRRDAVYSVVNTGPGSDDGGPASPQTAGLISLRTGAATRSGRGRKYVPFPQKGNITETGAVGTSYQAELVAMGGLMDDTVIVNRLSSTATLLPIVWSRKTGARQQISQTFARPFWATIRRRSKAGGGDPILP